MSWTPVFDSLALTSANGFGDIAWKEKPGQEVRPDRLLSPGYGIRELGQGGRVIEAEGIVRADTAAIATTRLDNWLEKLAAQTEKVLQLADDRYLEVYPRIVDFSTVRGANGKSYRWKATFTSREPYWRGNTLHSESVVNSASTVSDSIAYVGQAPVFPKLEVENTSVGTDYAGISLVVRNDDQSEEYRLFNFDLAAGDTMVLVPIDGELYIEDPADADSAAARRLDGSFWTLVNGSQTIDYEHTAANDSNLTFRLEFYDRYYHAGDVEI